MKTIRWYGEETDSGPGIEATEDPQWSFDARLQTLHKNMNADKITRIDSAFNSLLAVVQEILED